MLLTTQHPITTSYPVEASGWDDRQGFFVEKCELIWNEETGKCLTLSRPLARGALIFLRLLQFSSPDRSSPVPYHAHAMEKTAEGNYQFRLTQVRPENTKKH